MRNSRKSGFTLIELLTVIAIIAILAAFTMTVGPRLIERAKIRRMDSALRQVSIALTAYFADNQSYPPAYGYVSIANKDMPAAGLRTMFNAVKDRRSAPKNTPEMAQDAAATVDQFNLGRFGRA